MQVCKLEKREGDDTEFRSEVPQGEADCTEFDGEVLLGESDEPVGVTRFTKTKTHRGYGDLLAVERFDIKLNLRQQI